VRNQARTGAEMLVEEVVVRIKSSRKCSNGYAANWK